MAAKGPDQSTATFSQNWAIYHLYVRQEYDECLKKIEAQLKLCNGLCEYAVFVKGLIKRKQGDIQGSLQLFQAATCLNPQNVANLKQVARSLFLLGKFKAAIEVYNEAHRAAKEDRDVLFNLGLCYRQLKLYEKAIKAFKEANDISKNEETFQQIGRTYAIQEDFTNAVSTYLDALQFSNDNEELLAATGLLYLRLGEPVKAFNYLERALARNPSNPKVILAAGSIIQDRNEMDKALLQYRIAAVKTPNSAQLWNNIGMCFFGKKKNVAALACLKKAMYLDSFEWIIAYNLGLVYLNTRQYASAFHFISASINLNPNFPSSYMYLAIVLSRLDDFENACNSYEKAIDMEQDYMFHLNYAITLLKNGQKSRAKAEFKNFEKMFSALDKASQEADEDVIKQRAVLLKLL